MRMPCCGRRVWIRRKSTLPTNCGSGWSAWFTDPQSGRETRPQSYPHQISDYVMAAVRAGLRIDHISEHVVPDELATRMERARRYVGWPMLLMLRLRPI